MYALLSGPMVYTLFPLFSQENGIHHRFFCSVTSGSGDRPRKEGSRGGGVYSFFSRLSENLLSVHPILVRKGPLGRDAGPGRG